LHPWCPNERLLSLLVSSSTSLSSATRLLDEVSSSMTGSPLTIFPREISGRVRCFVSFLLFSSRRADLSSFLPSSLLWNTRNSSIQQGELPYVYNIPGPVPLHLTRPDLPPFFVPSLISHQPSTHRRSQDLRHQARHPIGPARPRLLTQALRQDHPHPWVLQHQEDARERRGGKRDVQRGGVQRDRRDS